MDHSLALTLSNVFKTASSLYPAVHVASVQTPDHERVLETRSVCKRLHECWSGIRRGAAVFYGRDLQLVWLFVVVMNLVFAMIMIWSSVTHSCSPRYDSPQGNVV